MRKNKKICLIFGGCGFIGSHVADVLLDHGYSVRIFDKLHANTANIDHILNDIELIEGDFSNEHDIKESIKGVDYIFHMIASTLPQTSYENPLYDIRANIVSTVQLLAQAAEIKKIKKIIFSSSGGTIYGIPTRIPIDEEHPTSPICPYGISKLAIEKYLYYFYKIKGLNFVSLRLSNPYGERQNIMGAQGVISVFLGKILHGQEIEIWGDGSIYRDFVYVKDVAEAFLRALENNNSSTIYNVGSGKGVSIKELIDLLGTITGNKIKTNFIKGREIDIPINVLKAMKAKKELGWKPKVSLEEGIKLTWDFLKKSQ